MSTKNDPHRSRLMKRGDKGDVAAIFQLQALDVKAAVMKKGEESVWLEKLKEIAIDGNLDAAYVLWAELTTGTQFGILNLIEARKFLEIAAAGGHVGAIADLQEQDELFGFWVRSAEDGSGLFAYNLYEAYRNGLFGEIDMVLAEQYLLRSAKLDYKPAKKQLTAASAVVRGAKK